MSNFVYSKGKGKFVSFVINSISSHAIFSEDGYKKAYIDLLDELENRSVCLLSYCVLETCAYVLVKAEDSKTAKKYIDDVNNKFYIKSEEMGSTLCYPFKDNIKSKEVNRKYLKQEVIAINRASESLCDFTTYPYSSYSDLVEGYLEAINIFMIEFPDLTQASFLDWFNQRSSQLSVDNSKEKVKDVIDSAYSRYIKPNGIMAEEVISFVIAEVCDRTNIPYAKAIKKLKVKDNESLRISVILSMVEDRHSSFMRAINILGFAGSDIRKTIIETVAEYNRIFNYSYDHIMSSMKINDYKYSLLTEMFEGMNRQYGHTFVQLCKKFHVVRDLQYIKGFCDIDY